MKIPISLMLLAFISAILMFSFKSAAAGVACGLFFLAFALVVSFKVIIEEREEQ